MGKHQDMTSTLGRTQASASHRLGILNSQGHHVNIEGDRYHATVTITRSEGYVHHITITEKTLDTFALHTPAFRRHPQAVMMSAAIHAIADWSEEQDKARACGCGNQEASALWNMSNRQYDWYCPTCFYGEAA